MRFYKYLLPLVTAMGLASSAAYALDDREEEHNRALNERDLQALKDFLRLKREQAAEKPDLNLSVSGDVHVEWRHLNEKIGDRLIRGGRARACNGVPLSRNDFDIEANIYLNYRAERTWATIQLQFDNPAGIEDNDCRCIKKSDGVTKEYFKRNRFHGSGECDSICLKRAFIGYTLWEHCNDLLIVELGRRKMYDILDSEIQFLSRFDGISLKYSGEAEAFGAWYATLGGFVVDERTNHFAWATELGLLDIRDSGFDLKYSFIDWTKRGRGRCGDRNPMGFKYCNSQLSVSYHLDPEVFNRPAEIFAAGVINHRGSQVRNFPIVTIIDKDGKKISEEKSGRHGHRRNLAWYAGVLLGEVVKEGDWSFEVQYQWVQENAIAWDDESGICLGDFTAECCGHNPTPGYKGWLIDVLYAVTDDLTMEMIIESSRKNQPGRRHSYSKFELEAIYAF